MHAYEYEAEKQGYRCIAGVDEAGRGPLAGPVVAAAVVLPHPHALLGLDDSKKLTPRQRERLFVEIRRQCTSFGIGIVDHQTVDAINILQASLLAMKQAVEQMAVRVELLLIDGNRGIDSKVDQKTIVGGDATCGSIAAASILAKVTRDRIMERYHIQYPQYEFGRHKGYGTALHRARIRQHGPCAIHRKTFKGVKEFLS